MNALRPRTAFAFSVILLFSAAAFGQHCDASREAWMDSLKANGIKAVDVAVEFDLFSDSHIALHVNGIHYFSDYVMNGFSEIKPNVLRSLPIGLENQLIASAQKKMQQPLRDQLTKQHITQGRGRFSYPLYDDECRNAAFFAPQVFGPTPLSIRPEGKRFAVISDVAETETVSGKKRTQVKVKSDDGWLYTYDDVTPDFRKDENVTINESDGYLVIGSLDGNTRTLRVKIVEKSRFFYL